MTLEMVRLFSTQKLPSSRQQELQHLKEYADSIASSKELQDLVHTCRISNAHQEGLSKISLSLSPHMHSVILVVLRLVAQEGAQIMHGAPPRGPIERQVEGTLRRLNAFAPRS
eukprot:2405303-Heterocapsa_arctica.AAC.1